MDISVTQWLLIGATIVGLWLLGLLWQDLRLARLQARATRAEREYAERLLALMRFGTCRRDAKGRFVRHARH